MGRTGRPLLPSVEEELAFYGPAYAGGLMRAYARRLREEAPDALALPFG